jgi:putative FmdB family regulatory protein
VPLYEFECQTCHSRFERIQAVAAPDPNCPKCGGIVERLLHAPAVQFKGSGWYVTDYAKSGGSGAKSDSKPGEKTETPSAPKTDAKSETKADTKGSGSSGNSKE